MCEFGEDNFFYTANLHILFHIAKKYCLGVSRSMLLYAYMVTV